jgi:transposase
LVEKSATLSKKSRLGEAFAYALNQWDALCYYCDDDGLAEPDNNAAERALRAVGLGKKNYIFFGSDHGGECGALLYGLIGTCRLNGIDPEAYHRHILSVLPEWPSNKVAELLPWNVDLTNKEPSRRHSLIAYNFQRDRVLQLGDPVAIAETTGSGRQCQGH